MRRSPILTGAGLLLLALAALCLVGCDVLEELFAESTPTSQTRKANPNNRPIITATTQPRPVGYHAVLEITELTCVNGEEDDFNVSSGSDEINFVFSLIETDASGYAVRSASFAWGPYSMSRGDSYNTNYFEDLKLSQIPKGHGVLIVLSIVEGDDYSKEQKIMDRINKYARYVEYANMFNPEPYSKTAIEIAGKVLDYLDIGLDIVDWADDNDTLADKVDVGSPDQVYNTLLGGGYLYNNWIFTGNNGYVILGIDYTDYFEYHVGYVVHLEPIY